MGYFKPYFDSSKRYYEGKCATCINYNITDIRSAYNDGYPCVERGKKRLAFDDSCKRYRKDRYRDSKDIENAFMTLERKYGKYKPHSYKSFYILSIICEELGLEDYQQYLTIGILFREEVLHKSLKYTSFLVEYDIYGRLIADSINKDEQKHLVCVELFDNYIRTFGDKVIEKNYDSAFNIYVEMFEKLKEIYKISEITTYDFENTYQTNIEDVLKLTRTI
ncbi:MAG: hypothetical protein E7172_04195 [Firmicutes bacterium]|nr:hypothetical protein [Bacillota bacterium]